MRTRTRDQRVLTKLKTRCTTATGLPVSPPYNAELIVDSAYDGLLATISDVNHGRNRHGLVLGPLDLSKSDRSHADGSISGYVPSWKETWVYSGDLIDGIESVLTIPSILGDSSSMSTIALIKAYAQMKQSSIMSGETLSDLGKTVGMLQHPFKNSRSLIAKMQKRKAKYLKKSASNLAQAASDAWLEYRYGWQPIYLDVAKIVEETAAGKFQKQFGGIRVARASERNSGTFKVPFQGRSGGGQFATYRYTGAATSEQSVVASSGILYVLANRTDSQARDKVLGTRTQDLVPLAWEKVPFSFVADWFVNIGDWLQAVTPDPFITVKGSWTTTVQNSVTTYSGTCEKTLSPSTVVATGSAGSSVRTNVRVIRTINPQLSNTPVLTLKPVSTLHQVDAMALSCKSVLTALWAFKTKP